MKRTPSFLFILALCALSWAAILAGTIFLVRWLGWPIAASIIGLAVSGFVGLIAYEIKNAVDAGD